MLKLTDVSFSYGDRKILDRVSLVLQPGERIALMGPSGCGKTTLLRLTLGLEKPESGCVENSFRKTAAVFQEPRLLPWRTALENVNLVLGDGKQTLPLAARALAETELADAVKKYPRELSGGMQQRVALARALAVEGDLLVLDEPFKGLDEALRQRMLIRIDTEKAAILLVTHDVREAQELNCRIVTL